MIRRRWDRSSRASIDRRASGKSVEGGLPEPQNASNIDDDVAYVDASMLMRLRGRKWFQQTPHRDRPLHARGASSTSGFAKMINRRHLAIIACVVLLAAGTPACAYTELNASAPDSRTQ